MSSTVSFLGTTNDRKLLLVIDCGTPASLKGPIQSIEVSYFVHATEDPQTIAGAVSSLLSVDVHPEEVRMEGHFGNTIIWVRYHLTGENAAAALASIAARMTARTMESLKRSIRELVDEHSALYLRFDKQRLVEGSLEDGSADPVRLKVKPRGFLPPDRAGEFYSKVLFGGT